MMVVLEQKMYLMAYRCSPWPNGTKKEDSTFMLVKGCIDLTKQPKKLGPADFTLEKIKKAALLKKAPKKKEEL